jgi:integrase
MATKLPSGMYRAQVYVGTDDNGKRKYESFLADTADEADFLALSFKLGKTRKNGKKTLREACEDYIEAKQGILVKGTIYGYKRILNNDFSRIMGYPIDKITSDELSKEIRKLLSQGNSSKTIKNKIFFIKSVLKENNIFLKTTIPRTIQREYAVPTPEEFSILFKHIVGTEEELGILLAAWLSLRRGEIFGLKYSDFHLNTKTLYVRRSMSDIGGGKEYKVTKTKSGERRIPLPDYICLLVATRMKRQKALKDDFVYPTSMAANRFYRALHRACKASDLPLYSLHSLRHLNASVMALLDVPEAYALKRGGWSSVDVMKNIYTTTFESEELAVANKLDEYFTENVVGYKADATQDATRNKKNR